jgi:hypothetical protein
MNEAVAALPEESLARTLYAPGATDGTVNEPDATPSEFVSVLTIAPLVDGYPKPTVTSSSGGKPDKVKVNVEPTGPSVGLNTIRGLLSALAVFNVPRNVENTMLVKRINARNVDNVFRFKVYSLPTCTPCAS